MRHDQNVQASLDELRTRTRDDLRGLVQGDLLFEEADRLAYAFDGSVFEIEPLGVLVPRSVADVVAATRYASEQGIPLHARGAGTGLAGESLGPGLVIDFSRYLSRVVSIESDSVVVQPGAVLSAVNHALEPLGRRIGPDPSEPETCTIGGMIAGDASGSRWLMTGSTGDALLWLDTVFADGREERLALEPWPLPGREPADFKAGLVQRLTELLRRNGELIARMRPRALRNRAGYALDRVAMPEGLNLPRLLAGSEGTLALVTQACLKTVPLPAAQAIVLLTYARWPEAARAVRKCLEFQPVACDMLDWRRVTLCRELDPELRPFLADLSEAALIVLFEGDDPEDVAQRARGIANALATRGGLAAEPYLSTRRTDVERVMSIRGRVKSELLRSCGRSRPLAVFEDIAVPPEKLQHTLQEIQALCRAQGVNWTFHAHAGHGQLHVRPFLDLSNPDDRARLAPLTSAVYDVVLAAGGTISGEHGCGLLRTPYLRRQYGPLVDVFREVKSLFDPAGLLNPGKVVARETDLPFEHLKTMAMEPKTEVPAQPEPKSDLLVLQPILRWGEENRLQQINSCTGCGDCRTRAPELRMCPTFRGLQLETATPRAQVNLLRQIASGEADPRLWGSEELRNHADLCVHCRLCRDECPSGIDVSSLMLEARAAYVENHGLSLGDWVLSRLDLWSRWGSRLPVLGRFLLGQPQARWLMERAFGLSRHRVVPRPRRFSFLYRADRQGLTRPRPHEPGPRVAYFVDLFANHFDPELGEAVVAVLRHAGVNVFVPRGQRGCGMPALVVGDFDHARDLMIANLRALSTAVRDGYTVVCSEPTAALMLREMATRLTDDLDADLVAKNTMDVGQYLSGLAERGRLPEPTEPLNVKIGYHQPCHLRALGVGTPGLDLVRNIPGVEAEFIDRGCSGIAGVFGLSKRNFRTSLRAGRTLRNRLKQPDLEIGATECGACRMQMEQGLTKRTLHPMKLLSMAYGLNPSLRRQFKSAKPRHSIS